MRPRRALRVAAFLTGLAMPGFANELTVTSQDLVRDPQGGFLASGLRLPTPASDLPVVGPDLDGPAMVQLRSLVARGQANGFAGILYDNRDRGHSALRPDRFPALTHLRYGPDLVAQQADYGLAGSIRYPAIVLGNSSTALTTGPGARSLSRLAMTVAEAQAASARLYVDNHLYVYPEHRDYDDVDLFPANWPYHVISQGSSGSDRPFLQALAATLAAFRPETLEAMRAQGLVAPTLQMILRRTLSFVRTEEGYFGGPAHRPVLSRAALRPAQMVSLANALRPEDVPPLVRLELLGESFQPAAGLAGMSERLFTTQSAIARIWRGFVGEQSMIVSAAQTQDPNGRALSFTWRLLQGDPERVSIRLLDDSGARAAITLRWHDAFSLPDSRPDGAGPRTTSRVDIGVFAHNGAMPSAPALISIAFPTHERRTYASPAGADAPPVLARIDYDAIGRGAAFDPILHWSAPWTDTARVDAAGTLIGWTRRYSDAARAEIDVPVLPEPGSIAMTEANGRMVLSDEAGVQP